MAIDLGNTPTGTPPTAGEKLQIRSAIGVGTTDAPTFLAQTLTGQSLTGTQATSLVDLAATWNTTGNPSLIYGRVTNTNSGASANLIDLGTFAGGSLFSVTKTGITKADSIQLPGGGNAGSSTISGQNAAFIHIGIAGHIRFWGAGSADMASFKYDAPGLSLPLTGSINWTGSASTIAAATSVLTQDAPGILAQRNADAAQAFRIYNFYNTGGVNYERVSMGWSSGTFVISREFGGTGGAKPISITGGSSVVGFGSIANAGVDWTFNAGHLLAGTDNTKDIGASGANRPRNLYAGTSVIAATSVSAGGAVLSPLAIYTTNGGVISLGADFSMKSPSGSSTVCFSNNALNDFNRLQLGNTTDAFPAIARDGAGIKFIGAAAGLTSWIKVPAVAVASLPLAATAGVGARSFVNDALAPVFGSAVTGGGAVAVPVYSTGSAWNVG